MPRILQQANIASCSGCRNCKWIPRNVSGIANVSGVRKGKRVTQTLSGFRILFISELAYEQLKARSEILIYSKAEFKGKDLTIVSGIHKPISKHLLTKSVDVTFYYFGNNNKKVQYL